MSTSTRQEIINAYDALLELQSLAEDSLQSDTSTIRTLEERIVTALPPKPRPTMAETEWDDSKHLLTEAEHSHWGKVVMLNDDEGICIEVLRKQRGKDVRDYARDYELTPTGKRYTLTEVQE